MVGMGEGSAIGFQLVVTNGVTNLLWNKIIRRVQTKKGQNTVFHTST